MVQGPVGKLRRTLRRLPVVALMVLATVCVQMASVLLHRYQQEQAGTGAVDTPAFSSVLASREASASELPPTGRFEAEIAYSVLDGGDVSTTLTWDDAWFFQDNATYNHELARAACVIATLAYAESNYYQSSLSAPAYMENALADLGFDKVSTDSYQFRSEVVDQVLNVFTQDEDAVAYTIARKTVTSSDSDARDLILVSVRGSYGSEWLSNLDFLVGDDTSTEGSSTTDQAETDQAESGQAESEPSAEPAAVDIAAAEAESIERSDHPGYTVAAQEIYRALAPWIEESHAQGHAVSLVLVGHSRGGAVANLVASLALDARANGMAGDETAAASASEGDLDLGADDAVSAYTFAAPRVTVSSSAHADRYASIFNIIHPADLMPSLPLEAWGYERYGVDLRLPAAGDAEFDERYQRMQQAFEQVMGSESTFDPEQVQAISTLVERMRCVLPTTDDLLTPNGLATAVGVCMTCINPVTVLEGHYPSVYIAWMQAFEGDELQLL